MPRVFAPTGDAAERVAASLSKIGGSVPTQELAYHTGLSLTEVIRALCELEEGGLVAPTHWAPAAP